MSEVIQFKEVVYVDRRNSTICMNDGEWVRYRRLFKNQGRDWAIIEHDGYWMVCMPTVSSGRYVQVTMIPPAAIHHLAELCEGKYE